MGENREVGPGAVIFGGRNGWEAPLGDATHSKLPICVDSDHPSLRSSLGFGRRLLLVCRQSALNGFEGAFGLPSATVLRVVKSIQ